MIIYIITFAITILLTYIVQKNEKKSIYKNIFIILIVFIPSFIGGMRDFTIGTDVLIYGKDFFEQAVHSSSFTYYQSVVQTDIGYAILNFIISRFTSNVNIFFLILQLIINGLMFATIYDNKKKVPMWFSMLIYLTVYYCRTYNYIRQSIALAIVLYSTKYIEQDKLKKYILCILVAELFHPTAIFAISLYLLKYIANSKHRTLYEGIILLAVIGVTLNISNVLKVLYQMGIVPERYYAYTYRFVNTTGGYSFIDVIYRVIWIIIYMIFGKKLRREESINNCYGMCLWLDLIFFFCRTKLVYADRISLYFGYTTILFIPKMIEKVSNNRKGNANIIYFISCIIFIVYWYMKFIVYGSSEVYPYTSSILGI